MSEWITDRLPTKDDAVAGRVLITSVLDEVYTIQWENVQRSQPWQRLPAPHVKPERFTLKLSETGGFWLLESDEFNVPLYGLKKSDYGTAELICSIYNDVKP
jgi:hypothetical protein